MAYIFLLKLGTYLYKNRTKNRTKDTVPIETPEAALSGRVVVLRHGRVPHADGASPAAREDQVRHHPTRVRLDRVPPPAIRQRE